MCCPLIEGIFYRKTSMSKLLEHVSPSKLDPPDAVVGMTEWQPRLFDCTVTVPCFTVPSNSLAFIVRECKPVFLKVPKINPVQEAQGLFGCWK